jgi:hypothetical protein
MDYGNFLRSKNSSGLSAEEVDALWLADFVPKEGAVSSPVT